MSILQAAPVSRGYDAPAMFQDLLERRVGSLADNRPEASASASKYSRDIADAGASPFERNDLQPTSVTVRTEAALHAVSSCPNSTAFNW